MPFAGIVVLAALVAAGSSLQRSLQSPQAQLPFIDAHVHLNEPDSAFKLMESSGLRGAIVFAGARGGNETVLAAAKRSGGRLIPFASVSPEHREYRDRWVRGDTTLATDLDRMLEGGEFRGIGEISVVHFSGDGFPEADFDPMGPVMQAIMRVAQRRQLPVLIHCEVTRLREFSALLDAFPAVRVIWAHGGYTQYVLATRMMERHANLTYELSARTWTSHPRSADYTIFRDATVVWPQWLALITRYPDRFIIGTDASFRSMDNELRKIERVRLLLSQLSDDARPKVALDNIRRLVGPVH